VDRFVWVSKLRCLGPDEGLYRRREGARLVGPFTTHDIASSTHGDIPSCPHRQLLDPGEIAYRLSIAMCVAVDLWRHIRWIRNSEF
jgi:hypothetical protein